MPTPRIFVAHAWEDSGVYLMARVVGQEGTPVIRSQLDSIVASFYDPDGEEEIVDDESLEIADVVFNTLQDDDPRWTIDAEGYNFRYFAPAAAFSEAGTVRVRILFTPVDGEEYAFPLVFDVHVRGLEG